MLAVFVACAAIRRSEARAPVKRAATVAAAVTAAQLLLGIGVVVMRVPTWLAVTHQAGAFVLSAAIVWTAWEARLLPRGLLAGALVTAPPEPALTPVAEPQIRA